MGASFSTSSADVINKAVATNVQIATNTCTATCNQIISGVDIILVGSTTGNITFNQKCTADASCMMTNALDQTVQVFQLANAKAESAAPILPIGLQINSSKSSTDNEIKTEMQQVLSNQCKGDVTQTITDVLVYATNSTTGDIGFVQEGNALARCVMDNTGRMQLAIKQEGTATASSGSTLGGLIGAIIAIVLITIIIGAIAKANKDRKANEQADQAGGGGSGGGQRFDTQRLASQYGGSRSGGTSGLTRKR